jgi:hypothetical protein
MAWTKVGETTFTVASGTGSENKALPGSPVENDIVILALACDSNLIDDGPSTPDYVVIEQASHTLPGNYLGFKILGATPDSSVDILQALSSMQGGIIQVWRGVDTTTPIDATRTVVTGFSGSPNPPAYEPVTDGALVFAVGFLDDDDDAANVTAPSGYTNLLAGDTGQADNFVGATVMIASKELATAAPENPAAFGTSSDAWRAVTFALRPGAGGVAEAEMAGTPQAASSTADGELDNRPAMDGAPQADTATSSGVAQHVALLAGTPQAATATSDGAASAVLETEMAGAPQAAVATTEGELDLLAQAAGAPAAAEATVDGALDLIAQLDGAVVASLATAEGEMETTAQTEMAGAVQADAASTLADLLAIATAAGAPQAAISSSEGVTVVLIQMSGAPQALFATVEGELILLGVRIMSGVPQALTATVEGAATAEQPEGVGEVSQQGLRQESFRAIGGTTGTYNEDARAAFEAEATVPAGATFNEAFILWLQARLSSADDNLPGLMQAFAEAEGADKWSSLGSFDPAA